MCHASLLQNTKHVVAKPQQKSRQCRRCSENQTETLGTTSSRFVRERISGACAGGGGGYDWKEDMFEKFVDWMKGGKSKGKGKSDSWKGDSWKGGKSGGKSSEKGGVPADFYTA
eukprot:1440479-Amphidinium_carterae.3